MSKNVVNNLLNISLFCQVTLSLGGLGVNTDFFISPVALKAFLHLGEQCLIKKEYNPLQ